MDYLPIYDIIYIICHKRGQRFHADLSIGSNIIRNYSIRLYAGFTKSHNHLFSKKEVLSGIKRVQPPIRSLPNARLLCKRNNPTRAPDTSRVTDDDPSSISEHNQCRSTDNPRSGPLLSNIQLYTDSDQHHLLIAIIGWSTSFRCLLIQLLGASPRRCNTTLSICNLPARSWYIDAINLFSRFRLSMRSCWDMALKIGWMLVCNISKWIAQAVDETRGVLTFAVEFSSFLPSKFSWLD